MSPLSQCLCAAVLATAVATPPSMAAPPGIERGLIDGLRAWLDANSEYPRRDILPSIEIVDPGHPALAYPNAEKASGRLRGVYDDQTATIYLVRPWSPDKVFDRSVLLHELTHHRQTTAKHWYCPQEQEWRAYQIQAQWLAEQGVEAAFYWPAIVLQSSCAKRDIHPE